MSDHQQIPPASTLTVSSVFAEVHALLVIAAPLGAAYLAEIAMMLTDLAIVGRLGSVQLAAVGLTGDLFFEIMLFTSAVISMAGVLVAEAVGAGNDAEASRQVRTGLVVGTALAIPAMLLASYIVPLLALTGQDPQVLVFGQAYLNTVIWCFLPAIWFVVLREFAAALSRPRAVMAITVGAVAVNAGLTYGLVFGAFGLPAMGVAGAGLATTIVTWAMFASLLWHVSRGRHFRRFEILAADFGVTLAGCRQIIVLGAPLGGLAIMEGGMFAVSAILIGTISADALAANQIVISAVAITFVITVAIGEAAAIRVAYGTGSSDPVQGQRSGLVAIGLGIGFMLIATAIFLTLPDVLAALFIDVDDAANREVVEIASTLFLIAGIFQIFDGMLNISSRALRGLRDTFVPMWIAAVGYWILGIPGGYALGFVLGYGAAGLWWGLAIGIAATSIMLTRRFVRLSWERRRLMHAVTPER